MDLSYLMCSFVSSSPHQRKTTTATAIETSLMDVVGAVNNNNNNNKDSHQQQHHHSTTTSSTPDLVESSCSETSFHNISDRSVDLSTSTIASTSIAPSATAGSGSGVAATTTTQHCGIPSICDSNSSKPGETSPSSLFLRRKLSTGIAIDPSKKQHPVLEGRPVIFQQNSVSFYNDLNSLFRATTAARAAAANSSTIVSNTDKNNGKSSSTKSPPHPEMKIAPTSIQQSSLARDRSLQLGQIDSAHLGNVMLPNTNVIPPFQNNGGTSSNNGNGDDKGSQYRREGTTTPRPSAIRRSYTCPSERVVAQQFVLEPAPLRLEAWSEPPAENFQVRGKTYTKDNVKVPCESSYFRLLTVDLINTPRPIFEGLCSHPQERVQQALKRERETGIRELPDFVFCVNLCVPGQAIYHNAFYFGVDKVAWEEIKNRSTPTGRLMNQFIFGDSDTFRNKTFKLIPRIVEGNYIVRKSVGSKPSILGKKIVQKYIRTDRYMEVIVDIASDTMAQRIVKLCLGYIKTIVVDMMFVLEGHDESTLPERIFGGVRLKNIDFKDLDGKRVVLPSTTS